MDQKIPSPDDVKFYSMQQILMELELCFKNLYHQRHTDMDHDLALAKMLMTQMPERYKVQFNYMVKRRGLSLPHTIWTDEPSKKQLQHISEKYLEVIQMMHRMVQQNMITTLCLFHSSRDVPGLKDDLIRESLAYIIPGPFQQEDP